jgi:hypothetical protein
VSTRLRIVGARELPLLSQLPLRPVINALPTPFTLQVLSKLPRISLFRGVTASSDLGQYNIVNCGAGSSGSVACSIVDPVPKGSTPLAAVQNPPNGETTIVNYAEPIAWYGILAFVMAILSVLFTIVFICGRYCCACCPRSQGRWCCICIQCGAHEPTRRTCLCGVVEKDTKPLLASTSNAADAGKTVAGPASARRPSGVADVDGAVGLNDGPVGVGKGFSSAMLAASPASTSSFVTVGSPSSVTSESALSPASREQFEKEFVYPKLERWLTLGLLLVFLAFMFSFTVIGAVLGVEVSSTKGLSNNTGQTSRRQLLHHMCWFLSRFAGHPERRRECRPSTHERVHASY